MLSGPIMCVCFWPRGSCIRPVKGLTPPPPPPPALLPLLYKEKEIPQKTTVNQEELRSLSSLGRLL